MLKDNYCIKTKEEILKIVEERERNEFFVARCKAVEVCPLCGANTYKASFDGWRDLDLYCFNKKCPEGQHVIRKTQ